VDLAGGVEAEARVTNLRAYLLRKLGTLAVTIFLVTSLNFFIFQVLPGDPTRTILPRGGGSPSDVFNVTTLREQLTHEWGLDRPVHERFGIYLWNLVQGNWGTSITYLPGQDVWTVILPRLWNTILFIGIATFVSIWVGIRLGRFAGWRRGRKSEVTLSLVSLVAYSLPTFWLAIVLIVAFAVVIPIFPTTRDVGPNYADLNLLGQIADRAIHMVLPLAAFVINNYAIFTLIMRNSLTEELTEDYMLTARAKGLSEFQQLRRHAIPNARLPVITVIALYVGWVFSGAIVIEHVFNLNGIGELTFDAILKLDYPLLSALFLLGTLGVVVANAVTDIAYSYLDPRVVEA
jgi:peptide/nickel transport system permease protein